MKNPKIGACPALGVLMETGYEKAVATLVAYIDGGASLYFSSGGGILGGIGDPSVRIAAARLTQFGLLHKPKMTPCAEFPMPAAGETKFYLLTPAEIYMASASEKVLSDGAHSFSPLFHLAHYLISRLRMITEKKPNEAPSAASITSENSSPPK